MQWENIDVTVDAKLSLLGNARRRLTLYHLLQNRYVDIDSLSVQIAAWEQDETVASVGDEARKSVKIDLHHNHLPRLADHGIVEFDPRSGDIVRDDRFDDIRPVVARVRNDEEMDAEDGSGTSVGEESGPFLSP